MAMRKRTKKSKRAPRKSKGSALLLPMNDDNLEKLRHVLKSIHSKIMSVHDVMVVVSYGLENSPTEYDEQYGRVLKRNACNPLCGELVELRFTIRQLGGHDLFPDVDDDQDEEERNSNDRSFT